jgi:hypothetical protein
MGGAYRVHVGHRKFLRNLEGCTQEKWSQCEGITGYVDMDRRITLELILKK